MKRNNTVVIAAVIAVIVCGAGIFAYLALRTFAHAGDQAVAQMNAEEKEWLQRTARIHAAMDVAEVYAIVGDPTSELIFGLAKWDGFAGSKLSQLRVYFVESRPRKIRWLKLGYFLYERDL